MTHKTTQAPWRRAGGRQAFAAPMALIPRGTGLVLCLAALTLAIGLPVRAADNNSKGLMDSPYVQALCQSEFLAAEVENAVRYVDYPPPLPPCPERLLSLNRNAGVTIGGDIRASYIYTRAGNLRPYADGDAHDPLTQPQRTGLASLGDFANTRSRLSVDLAVGPRWRARLDLDLTGYAGPRRLGETANVGNGRYVTNYEEDFLHAAYVELLKAGHSGFGLKVGRFDMPWGVVGKYSDLIAQSYMDSPDLTGSSLLAPDGWDGAVRLPHASGLLHPAVAAMASYEMRDIIRFEAAVFQERHGGRPVRVATDGTYVESASESPAPRSYQFGASILPLEGWELSVAFRNRYSRTRGIDAWVNSPYRTDFRSALASGTRDPVWNGAEWADSGNGPAFGSTQNEQALIAGLAVEIPNTNLAAQLEYAHGWNQGFNEHISSDDVNLALSYRLTPWLTLHGQGEWLHVRDRSWLAADGAGGVVRDTRRNDLYRFMLGLEYEFLRGVSLEAGWQYEYWRFRSDYGGDDGAFSRNLNANTVYMGSKFLF